MLHFSTWAATIGGLEEPSEPFEAPRIYMCVLSHICMHVRYVCVMVCCGCSVRRTFYADRACSWRYHKIEYGGQGRDLPIDKASEWSAKDQAKRDREDAEAAMYRATM
jgi:hypothetical protein